MRVERVAGSASTRLRPDRSQLGLDRLLALRRPRPRGAGSPAPQPSRTSAASGTPRNDRPSAAQPMASSRLVLPCAVVAHDHRDAGRQLHRDALVAPEVGELERRDVHAAQAMRTGINRYRKSAASLPRSTAGFSGSIVSMVTSGDAAASTPSSRNLRVERHGHLGALELRLDRLVRLADVLRGGGQLEAVGSSSRAGWATSRGWCRPPGCTRSTALRERVALDREPVRVPARDQLLVVREVALDQARRDVGAVELGTSRSARRGTPRRRPRRGAAAARPGPSRRRAPSGPRAGGSRPGGPGPRAGTSRWPRGRTPSPVAASSTPVRIGRASSRDAAGTTWRSPSASGACGDRDRVRPRLGQPREVGRREGAHLGAERPASIFAWSSPDLHRDRRRVELAQGVDEQPGDEHRGPLALDVGRHARPDRELEVGPGELHLAGPKGHLEPGQDRQRAGARGDRTLRRAHRGRRACPRSQMNFTLGAPSVSVVLPSSSTERKILVVAVVGPVDCGRPDVRAGQGGVVVPRSSPAIHRAGTLRGSEGTGGPQFRTPIPSNPQGSPHGGRHQPLLPRRIRAISSLTCSNVMWRSVIWCLIFSTAYMTVVWSRPPKASAMRG